MEGLNIVLGLVVGLLGFPVGLILAKIAKEELKQGKKYFKLMSLIIIVLIIGTLIYVLISGFSISVFILLCSLIFLLGLPLAALVKL